MKYLLFTIVLFFSKWAGAQRIEMPFNSGWQFSKDNFSFKSIIIPHTWNAGDVMDDAPGYYRGEGWYKKNWTVPGSFKGKEIYLYFNGANQETTVFVNGKEIKKHIGGYTGFSLRITPYLQFAKPNEIAVKVDNSHNKNIPPLSADFTFYGGIYRNIKLIALDPVHFSLDKYGSRGLFVSTPAVNQNAATVNIRSVVQNELKEAKKIVIQNSIYNADGQLVQQKKSTATIQKYSSLQVTQNIPVVKPVLWSTRGPYLYKIVTHIIDASSGKKIDEIVTPLGIRSFYFDADRGFFLNGEYVKLMGANRHQDMKGLGNALTDDLHIKDVRLLKEMGGNFLRVAHYPQDPAVLAACDSLGILASVEIPVVNEITETDSFYNTSLQMQQEMIRQNFNHPSVIIWCYMNEILLRPSFNNDKQRQKLYFSNITRLARSLDSITRKEDSIRYTMIAHHGNYNLYKETGLIDVPMIVGWNLYSGWYGANMNDMPAYLDRFHKEYPGKITMVTEYGADADPRIRSKQPVRFDKSAEYALKFHQYYYKEIMQRPFVAAGMIWNLADFNSETRNETMPHINNKGLLQWDRTPKDLYHYYKAVLSDKPFIKILGDKKVAAIADSATTFSSYKLVVASNATSAKCSVNGREQTLFFENGIATAKIELFNGANPVKIWAQKNGNKIEDEKNIECLLKPYMFSDAVVFSDINILCGANRTFADSAGNIWLPDQAYKKGVWGHIGGRAFKLNKSNLPYGTDKNIKATENDPVYQTQQTGIEAYRMDVPDGEYELKLHFAELLGGTVNGLLYNLDAGGRIEDSSKRIFSVWLNGVSLQENINLAEQPGIAVKYIIQTRLTVRNDKGIFVEFKPAEGEAVLNALQLKRLK